MKPFPKIEDVTLRWSEVAGKLSTVRQITLALAITTTLAACSVLDTPAQRGYSEGPTWNTVAQGDAPASTTSTIFTTGDVRMVSQRTHPLLKNPVVCTDPAPDVAIALSTAAAATAQGGNGAASGSLGVSGSSAEAVAELAGRSTALLGLRDSLYRACEAYANGSIGQDAYALVISHISQLMTTTFLAQDIVAATPKITVPVISPTLQNLAPPQAATSKAATTTTTTTTPTASYDRSPSGIARLMQATLQIRAGEDTSDPTLVQRVAAVVAVPDPNAPATTPQKATTDQGGTTQNPSTPASSPTVNSAVALTRMNEDYMHLGVLGVVVIGCINNADRTRFRPPTETNTWLDGVCAKIDLAKLEAWDADAAKWPFVDPTATGKTATSTITVQKTVTKAAGDQAVAAVQAALLKLDCVGCNPGRADGIVGNDTRDAVRAYQAFKGLLVNGDPKDPTTVKSLGLPAVPAPGPPAAPAAKKNA